jgi:imidazolonepropionase-like amidohydrolase
MMDEECVDLMVKQNTFVTPSLYFPWMVVEEKRRTGKSNWGGADEMERGLEHSYKILPIAQKAGVKFVIGDDFGVGAMPHGEYTKELEAYVRGAGISPLDVITWATKNGAELLGMGDELGTIEPGKLADLLVVDGNPAKNITVLQDRENLDVVMKGGQFVTCQLTPSKARIQKAA